jgi:hypothetical protein
VGTSLGVAVNDLKRLEERVNTADQIMSRNIRQLHAVVNLVVDEMQKITGAEIPMPDLH